MKLGVLTKTLGMSQQSFYIAQEGNALASSEHDIDLVVFYGDHDKIPMFCKFSLMQDCQIWGYNGPVISTDTDLAKILIRCPSLTKRYLYVWNLEWLYIHKPYREWADVFMHDDLHLIARSPMHYDIIKSCWKEPCMILEDFNHEQIATLAK